MYGLTADSGLDPLQRTPLMLEALPNSPAGGMVREGRPRRRLAANRCGRIASIGCEQCACAEETLKGEARAGNTRGERGEVVCIRASDAHCAGMPNLGSSGLDREDLIPQLCAASCCWQRTWASGHVATAADINQRVCARARWHP